MEGHGGGVNGGFGSRNKEIVDFDGGANRDFEGRRVSQFKIFEFSPDFFGIF